MSSKPSPVIDLQLLHSTEIAVLWLDMQLNVRHFTPAIGDLLEILATDIGRPLSHLAREFTDADLLDHATRVMATPTLLWNSSFARNGLSPADKTFRAARANVLQCPS